MKIVVWNRINYKIIQMRLVKLSYKFVAYITKNVIDT